MDAFPFVLSQPFRPKMTQFPWIENTKHINAWQQSLTGYPIIDAAMRELLETGWMHNRARMITASFLTKDLLINWQYGEKWFMQNLIDGDAACNNGGWQWSAGSGTDAAPFFRIFNPILQAKKYDPGGDYVRKWVPEVARLPNIYLHEPWTLPYDLQTKYNFAPGKQFPLPIIDHQLARERALTAFRNLSD
jgi:deoxyribodipyrimidine photo-lyase